MRAAHDTTYCVRKTYASPRTRPALQQANSAREAHPEAVAAKAAREAI